MLTNILRKPSRNLENGSLLVLREGVGHLLHLLNWNPFFLRGILIMSSKNEEDILNLSSQLSAISSTPCKYFRRVNWLYGRPNTASCTQHIQYYFNFNVVQEGYWQNGWRSSFREVVRRWTQEAGDWAYLTVAFEISVNQIQASDSFTSRTVRIHWLGRGENQRPRRVMEGVKQRTLHDKNCSSPVCCKLGHKVRRVVMSPAYSIESSLEPPMSSLSKSDQVADSKHFEEAEIVVFSLGKNCFIMATNFHTYP